jgi:hypothetical protein
VSIASPPLRIAPCICTHPQLTPFLRYITRYVAGIQQKYTQSGGTRPFGISTLIVGFDTDGTPALYQTDPSGIYSAWKANAIGKSSKTVKEFLEKKWSPEAVANEADTVKVPTPMYLARSLTRSFAMMRCRRKRSFVLAAFVL